MRLETPEQTDAIVWMARVAGALAGSAISLGYLLPRRKREAFLRFGTGVVAGLVFGAPVGIHLMRFMDMQGEITRIEMNLIGATLVSLCAWSALGIASRLMRRNGLSIIPDDEDRRTHDADRITSEDRRTHDR